MFTKYYSYTIAKKDVAAWKRINRAAWKVYEKYGKVDWTRMIRKDGKKVHVVELEKYKNKAIYARIAKKVHADPSHKKLVEEFEKKLEAKDFVAEEFETC